MLATPGDLPVGPEWVYEVEWDGLAKNGQRVAGALTVRVVAVSDVGRSELRTTVAVRKATAPRG